MLTILSYTVSYCMCWAVYHLTTQNGKQRFDLRAIVHRPLIRRFKQGWYVCTAQGGVP